MNQYGISTAVAPLETILSARNYQLTAPLYQRLYEWGTGQITKLVTDVIKVYKDRNGNQPNHFLLGNVVLRAYGHGQNAVVLQPDGLALAGGNAIRCACEIIDGQQRLTTMVILYAVIHDMLLKEHAKCIEAGQAGVAGSLEQLASQLRERLEIHMDGLTNYNLCVTPRVFPEPAFYEVFRFPGVGAPEDLLSRIER